MHDVPEVVPPAGKTHDIVIAFVMQRDERDVSALPVHGVPEYAVVDGVRKILSPTAALLYAVSKF